MSIKAWLIGGGIVCVVFMVGAVAFLRYQIAEQNRKDAEERAHVDAVIASSRAAQREIREDLAAVEADDKARARASTVVLQKLFDDYSSNALGADSTYKDRYVKTSGVVLSVRRDSRNRAFVDLGVPAAGANGRALLMCYLADAGLTSAASLKKGDSTSVLARIDGMRAGVVVGSSCSTTIATAAKP